MRVPIEEDDFQIMDAPKRMGEKKLHHHLQGTPPPPPLSCNVEFRAKRENLTEFIAKKKEMFLVQYALGIKREEITKLEEIAQVFTHPIGSHQLIVVG